MLYSVRGGHIVHSEAKPLFIYSPRWELEGSGFAKTKPFFVFKEKYGVRVLSALEPIAEDEGGEFYEMFLDWNAEKYSKRLSKRVKDGLDTSVANGTYCGGTLIYGYRIENEPVAGKSGKFIKRVTVCEEEAFILRYAFEQYAKGVTKK